MSKDKGWIGVDLDGTLAHYDGWKGAMNIGAPILPMLHLVKNMLLEGKNVKIFTARVGPQDDPFNIEIARKAIQDWCEEHLGVRLEVTNQKDFGMIMLYDDRCVQVEKNTGRLIGEE